MLVLFNEDDWPFSSGEVFFLGVNDNDGSGNSEGCGATTGLCLSSKYGEVRVQGSKGFAVAGKRFFAGDIRLEASSIRIFMNGDDKCIGGICVI